MRPAPTGLTLMPTTSLCEKKSLQLSANGFPVRDSIPLANMAATTLSSTPFSLMAASSLTETTRPGKSPGREYFVRGMASASSMLVLGRGGGSGLAVSCPHSGGRPSSSPAPSNEPPPIFKKSRRSNFDASSIDRYALFFISHLHAAGSGTDYNDSCFFGKILVRPPMGFCSTRDGYFAQPPGWFRKNDHVSAGFGTLPIYPQVANDSSGIFPPIPFYQRPPFAVGFTIQRA